MPLCASTHAFSVTGTHKHGQARWTIPTSFRHDHVPRHLNPYLTSIIVRRLVEKKTKILLLLHFCIFLSMQAFRVQFSVLLLWIERERVEFPLLPWITLNLWIENKQKVHHHHLQQERSKRIIGDQKSIIPWKCWPSIYFPPWGSLYKLFPR